MTGLSILWCWPFMMYAVFIYYHNPLLIVVLFWHRIVTVDILEPRYLATVDSKSSWRLAILTCCHAYSFVLCSLHDITSILLQHLFSRDWIRLSRCIVQSSDDKTTDLKSLIFVEKLIALFFHSTASLVMAECACASLIFTPFNVVPSLLGVDPKYLIWSTSSITFHSSTYWWMALAWCVLLYVDEDFAFVGDDFHTVSSSCFLRPFSSLLQFFFVASHKIDIVSKPQVAKRSSSDEHWRKQLPSTYFASSSALAYICILFTLCRPDVKSPVLSFP